MSAETYRLPPSCGVYHLLKDDRVVYVGQSANVLGRISQWTATNRNVFDAYRVFGCATADLNRLEREHIQRYDPPLNKAGRTSYYKGVARLPRGVRHYDEVFTSVDEYLAAQTKALSAGKLCKALRVAPNATALLALAAAGHFPAPACQYGGRAKWDRDVIRHWWREREAAP